MPQTTRRGFLAGLFGTAVIVALPKATPAPAPAVEAIDPWAITAPPGTTYQWVRTALLGDPDPANVQARLDNGWKFVTPSTHPGAPVSTVEHAIETQGLILMGKPTVEVEKFAASEKAARQTTLPEMLSSPRFKAESDADVVGVFDASGMGRHCPSDAD